MELYIMILCDNAFVKLFELQISFRALVGHQTGYLTISNPENRPNRVSGRSHADKRNKIYKCNC